jgi:hypothetical protein
LQAWGFSWPVDSIVADHSFSLGEPMVPVAGGAGSAFAPNDDLDLEIGAQLARGLPAGRGPVGGGVVALETRVEYPGAEGAWAPPRSISVPKATPSAPTQILPSADEALAIVRKHLTIEARETDPARGALVAVSTEAYDATVDKDAFKLDWCRATLSVKPGEPDPCDPRAVRAPVKASGQQKVPSFASQPTEALTQKASERAPWVPPASTWTLGLNTGTVYMDEGDLDTGDLYEVSESESQYSLAYARGVRRRLRVGAAYGDDVLTVSGGVGRGMSLPRLGRLELEPHFDAGISVFSGWMDISGPELSTGGETTAFADVGTDVRLHLARGLSLTSGFAWRQQLATISGPVLGGMQYDGSGELRDATGLRVQFGLGFAFSGGASAARPNASRAMASRSTDEATAVPAAAPAVAAKDCGVEPCADAAAEKESSFTKVPLPAFELPAAYTFRHYAWTEFNTWSSGARNTLLLSVDLGGRSVVRVDRWDGDLGPGVYEIGELDSRETLFGLGYSRGIQNRLRTRLFYGTSGTPYESSVLTFSTGYGRAIPFARNVFEIEPHADAGVALFSINGGGETTAFVDVGGDARWFVHREVSLYAGAAWRQPFATLSGPVVDGVEFPVVPIRDATGLRFQLGVGYHF